MPQPANFSSLSSFPPRVNPRLGQKFQSIKCHDRNHQQQAVSRKDKGSWATPNRAHEWHKNHMCLNILRPRWWKK